ncbi:ankyrin repeat-containing protein BDA1-like [Cornus florida]|uniref:ankyrin repeat-containing protein BDA1-like n=1 Tax=Cornus florida TaxID=4283 RepID=UPI00289AA852|nr:ankyrin repeat-containing protein BDA1-like [Cornus florida]
MGEMSFRPMSSFEVMLSQWKPHLSLCQAKDSVITLHEDLHVACREEQPETVKALIHSYGTKQCFSRDKFGGTPLHIAAMRGRIDVMKELLDACPESVKEVNATGKTCLHTAVMYKKGKVVRYLLKWLWKRSTEYAHLVNVKDQGGNTVLHFATSRKQLQTLKVLLAYDPNISNLVEVNALNSSGFTALDILDVLPDGGKLDMEIDKILRRAGALKARDVVICGTKHDAVYDCRGRSHQACHKAVMTISSKSRKDYARTVLLAMATLVTTITFLAVLCPPFGTLKQGYPGTLQLKKQHSIITRSFILFNTVGFVASLAILIFLLYEFPLKPWPQISVSSLFGSYACLIMAISAGEALLLLALAIPVLLLAATGRLNGFARQSSY